MPASIATECPSREKLAEYALGTLPEADADALGEHLEGCQACQKRVDDQMKGADSLVGVLRGAPDPKVDTRQLPNADDLISKAKLLAPTRDGGTSNNAQGVTAPSEQRPKPPINPNIAAFLATLTKSGLMTREEIDALADSALPQDAKEFAKELVAAKKLTNFQATALLRGISRGLVLGNYVILDKLGRGGMGHVYKARHRTMGRIVCIKTLPAAATQQPEMLERFRREARAVAALNHPNIVVGHDAAESDGIHYLVMEFIEGSDLAKRAKDKAFPVSEAIGITLQTAKALAYAHRQGIVHRDIKPHNLLLDGSGNVKILDMGIARFDAILGDTCDASGQATMTNTGVVMGTVDFMSPEQALNTRKADARSDVYSLGCTLYYILTRKPLFGGDTVMEKLVAHRETAPPRLADEVKNVPPGLEAVFRKMVAKEPRERYASMDALAADLEAVQAGQRPKAQSGRAVKFVKSRWKSIAGVAAAVVALALILPGFFKDPASDRDTFLASGDPTGNAGNNDATGQRPDGRQTDRGERIQQPVVGHAHTRFNGGNGRYLLMVPFDSYEPATLNRVLNELTADGVAEEDLVVLSSQAGYATGANGSDRLEVDFTLDEFEFDVNDFDGVIVAGSNAIEHEFGHKNSLNRDQVSGIFNECLSEVRAIVMLGEAHKLILDNTLDRSGFDLEQLGCCGIMTSETHSGRVIKFDQSGQVRQTVDLLYRQLDRRHMRSEGGPGRALLVVSKFGYNAESLRYMQAALEARGIEYDVAAEQVDPAQFTRGSVQFDVALHDVTGSDYDAVIFCDGEQFGIPEAPQCLEHTQKVVASMMTGPRVVAGIGSGWDQLQGAFEGTTDCDVSTVRMGFAVATPKDRGRRGRAVGSPAVIATSEDAAAFVRMIFDAA